MAFDKRKALQNALAHTQQGRLDKAIVEYQAVLKADPGDLTVNNLLGDLYARIGNKEEAISHYLKLGELYRADGLSVKAIAVYKKIIKLDSTNVPSYLACGDLYAEQGLVAEARIQYLTAADFLGRQGLTQKALSVYQKLADLDPANLKIRAKLAEMLLKESLPKEAGEEFLKLASGCMQLGQLTEAERFLERVLQIQPDSGEAQAMLGRVHFRQPDYAKAAKHLSWAWEKGATRIEDVMMLVESHEMCQDLERAEAVLAQAVGQHPQHEEAKVTLGKLRLKMGKIEEAHLVLVEVAEGRLRRNQVEAGLELLRLAPEADPGFVKGHQKLAEVYRRVGREAEARKAYHEIASLCLERQDEEEARKAYLAILQFDPNDQEVQEKLEKLEHHAQMEVGEPEPPVPEVEMTSDAATPEDSEGGAAEEPLELPPVEAPAGAVSFETEPSTTTTEVAPPIEEVPPLIEEGAKIEAQAEKVERIVEDHLVEAEIYLKYSLIDKAIDHLRSVLEVAPENVEAHRKLKAIHADRGDHGAAIGECLTLAEIFEKEGNRPDAIAEIRSAIALDPLNAETKKILRELTAEGEPSTAMEPFSEEAILLEAPIERVTPVEEFEDLEVEEALEIEGQPSFPEEELPEGLEVLLEDYEMEGEEVPLPSSSPSPRAEARTGIEEDLAEADFYLQHEMLMEAVSIYERILAIDPDHQVARERLSQVKSEAAQPWVEGEFGERSLEVAEGPELEVIASEPDMDSEVAATIPYEEDEVSPPLHLAEEEAPMDLPLAAAAPPEPGGSPQVAPVFKVGLPTMPGDGKFVDFAAELERDLAKEAEVQPLSLEELGRGEMTPPTLNEILQEFQKGVRQSLEEKDFETHYNLGIAYRDMDLLEEAIEEFRLASRDPHLAFDSSQLIGLCYMKMGVVDAAIEEFLRGLSIPDQGSERYRGLKYELALAYEAAGDDESARQLLAEVYGGDPGFRDVKDRLERFVALQPELPPEPTEILPPEEKTETEKPATEQAPSPKKPRRKVHYI